MRIYSFVAKNKYPAIILMDMFLVGLFYSLTLSYLNMDTLFYSNNTFQLVILLVVIYFCFFTVSRLYRSLWQYAEIQEFAVCGGVSMLAGLTYCVIHWAFIGTVPFSHNLLAVMIISIVLVSYRFLYRTYRRRILHQAGHSAKAHCKVTVLLVGAGNAGAMLLEEMRKNRQSGVIVIGFVDDDLQKYRKAVNGIPVLGTIRDIPDICEQMKVDGIYICIPSATLEQRQRILDYCAKTPCPTKILPEFFSGMIRPINMQESLRDISINDLLNREVNMNLNKEILGYIQDKTVLVTGGGGSIGSELCRQIASGSPKKLIIVDIYENNAYDIQQELLLEYRDRLSMVVEIASVRDNVKMEEIFSRYLPNLAFHAAAHALCNALLMEHSPDEAVKNNVFWHLSCGQFGGKSIRSTVSLLISTDKAVSQ